jgi:DNA-directed RNA polymerase II subunit RPB2
VSATQDKCIRYTNEVLLKEILQYVCLREFCKIKIAFFFGYMIHRLLLAALKRRYKKSR